MEIWLPIKGYEGKYELSSFGRVRSLNYHRTGQTKYMILQNDKYGYKCVPLRKNGKLRLYKVHRLVAEAFIPNLFGDPQVNHIDEDKTNNHVDNLEWCDAKYNVNYGTAIERSAEKQSKPVLQFTKTGEFVREWPSTTEAGRNGFNQGNIVSCCSGKRKYHHGYIWKYKEVV